MRTDAYMTPILYFSLLCCISHGAVALFSNRSGMTSKCGKNRKMAHKPLGECVTDFFFGIYGSVCLKVKTKLDVVYV